MAREMWFQQWELARMCRAPFANPDALKQAGKIFSDNGVAELIVYIGGPQTVDDLETAKRNVDPYLAMATATMQVSIGLDTLTAPPWPGAPVKQWTEESSLITEIVKLIRSRGAKVYGEPRMTPALIPTLGKYIDGTISTPESDKALGLDLSKQPGEVIQLVSYGKPVTPGATPLVRMDNATAVPVTTPVTVNVDVGVNWGAQ